MRNQGQAALISTLFLMFISMAIIFLVSSIAVSDIQVAARSINSEGSFALSEGGLEDAIIRILNNRQIDNEEVISLNGRFATTTIQDSGNTRVISSHGDVVSAVRKTQVSLSRASGANFFYGVQVGNGGIFMENNSQIIGNVYANGSVIGQNSNLIRGDVVSAGSTGLIDGIHATGTAYAHTIQDSTIDKDAHYQVISGTTVGGTLYPGSSDQSSLPLPISDEQINQWEQDATSTVISSPCPYKIENDVTLGPVKISCSVEVSGDPVVTLNGPVWITGNLDIKNTAIIRIAASLGSQSVPIVVDNPSNRLTSSKIILQNSVEFQNSGTDGSYILVISQNNSSETGGSERAIEIKNSASGDLLLYAAHGHIEIQNSSNFKEVSAYKVHLKNSASVTYESGLADLLFQSGPSGGWDIEEWKEIP